MLDLFSVSTSMVLKFGLCSRHDASPIDSDGGDQPGQICIIFQKSVGIMRKFVGGGFVVINKCNLSKKNTVSTPLMMENPVRSPMVPPMADNMSTNLAALALVILSKVVA